MGLSEATVRATAAVSDMSRARAFYEDQLGLTARPGGPGAVRMYPCGAGSVLQVYVSPEHAGASTATVASWSVTDHDAVVDELTGRGVRFLRYEGLDADARAVHTFGAHRIAWCADPDGNVLAIDNGRSSA